MSDNLDLPLLKKLAAMSDDELKSLGLVRQSNLNPPVDADLHKRSEAKSGTNPMDPREVEVRIRDLFYRDLPSRLGWFEEEFIDRALGNLIELIIDAVVRPHKAQSDLDQLEPHGPGAGGTVLGGADEFLKILQREKEGPGSGFKNYWDLEEPMLAHMGFDLQRAEVIGTILEKDNIKLAPAFRYALAWVTGCTQEVNENRSVDLASVVVELERTLRGEGLQHDGE